jgi:hypothetical protein
LPQITQQVNQGEHFSQLRQIYNALILGVWFKNKLKDSVYKNYIAQSKTNGIDRADKEAKNKIYSQYLNAFKQGSYNYTKQERAQNKLTKRQYFSGGVSMDGLGSSLRKGSTAPIPTGRERLINVNVHPADSDDAMVGGAIGRWECERLAYDPISGTLTLVNPYRIPKKIKVEPEFGEFDRNAYAKRRDIMFFTKPADEKESGEIAMVLREKMLPVNVKVVFLEDKGDDINRPGFYRLGGIAAKSINGILFIRRSLWDTLTLVQKGEMLEHEYYHSIGKEHKQIREYLQRPNRLEPLTPAIKVLFAADKIKYSNAYDVAAEQNTARAFYEQEIAMTKTPPPIVLVKRVSNQQVGTSWLKFLGEVNTATRRVNTGSFNDNTGLYPKLIIDDKGIALDLIARGDLDSSAQRRITLSLDEVNLNSDEELADFIQKFNDELRRYPEWAQYSRVSGRLSLITKDPDKKVTLAKCRAMVARLQIFLRSCAKRAAVQTRSAANGGINVTKDTINLKTIGKGNDFKINNNGELNYATLVPSVVAMRDLPAQEFAGMLEK